MLNKGVSVELLRQFHVLLLMSTHTFEAAHLNSVLSHGALRSNRIKN